MFVFAQCLLAMKFEEPAFLANRCPNDKLEKVLCFLCVEGQ